MDMFEYRPANVLADTVKMDGPTSFVGTGDAIRSRAWAYTLGRSGLLSASRNAREVECVLYADYETADALRRAADADVQAGTPGTFVACGEWSQRGYVLSSAPGNIHFGRVELTLTIALLDGAWWRLRTVSLMPGSGSGDASGLGYNYGYNHDYTKPQSGGRIDNQSLVACKPRLVFYGAVTDPYIIIAGNKYQVTGSVASGARIEVDGRDMTVKMVTSDGTVTDKFSSALRGSGEGGGQYIFQPIPPGVSGVTWDDSFGVDVCWYEEEGEPPWNLS